MKLASMLGKFTRDYANQDPANQDPRKTYPDLYHQARAVALHYEDSWKTLQLEQDMVQTQIPPGDRRALLVQAWKDIAKNSAPGHIPVSLDTQNSLARYINHFNLHLEELDDQKHYTNLMKSAILRDVQEGILPLVHQSPGTNPLRLEEGEQLIWVSEGVQHSHTVTVEQSEAVIHSLNMPVGPTGAYLGPESFPSRPVQETQEWQTDTGMLAVSDKNIHFAGPINSFKLGHEQHIPFHRPSMNGQNFKVHDNIQDEETHRFTTPEAIFLHRLITILSERQQQPDQD